MDSHNSMRQKVKEIFSELASDKANKISGDRLAKDIIFRIKEIYTPEIGTSNASTLGMHMSDWNYDAAFIVAMHLYPEQFTDEEIREGIEQFHIHAPNHILAACKILDQEPWDDFPDADPSTWEDTP